MSRVLNMSFFRGKRKTITIVFKLLTYILVYAIGKFYGHMDRMCPEVANDLDLTLKSLFQKVESLQVKHDTPYIPPAFWQKHKGMWETDFKFYFHGSEEMYLLREAFSIYDENMFATAWITSCLIEAFRFGKGPKPSEKTISAAVSSLEKYHDNKLSYSNSLMTFWPQQYNKTHGVWTSYSVNSLHYRELVVSTAAKILKVEVKGIADVMEKFHKNLYPRPASIPSDFDDTFVNLGIGALLAEMKEHFPIAHAQWQSQNTNVTSVFDALKKYAYRPMSTNKAINAIDCRTYFFLRFFLEKAKENGEDIALVPTWIQDTEEARMLGANGDSMPFSYNNIDVTVAANVVFGTTSAVLNGVVGVSVLDDPKITQIYVNTSNLIAYMIETNFSSRPDLALLYYPSAIDFYWFIARTYGEIRRKENHGPLPHPVLKKVESILDRPLHVTMTSAIVKQAHIDDDGNIYFEDFLGNGDNSTKAHGEDRLFTTAIAMNALLSTWTVFDEKTERLYWEKGTPDRVKDILSKSARFLQKHIFGLTYKPLNVFFSGSLKGKSTFPIYPSTRDRKGAFEGVVSEEDYHQLLKQNWSGQQTPIDFHGYNNYPEYWPFWSSEPYTYATTLLALSKFTNTFNV